VTTALSTWCGHTLALPRLTQLDADIARVLVPLTRDTNAPWDRLVLGGRRRINGITPKVADWITELRMVDVDVVLSPESEQAVRESSTYSSRKPRK
jgi:hypothetical protein